MEQMAAEDRRLTYADFLLFPDDGMRHEIIDGVHYVTASPNLGHQDLVGRLHLAIGNHLATRRHQGRVFLSPLDVVMSNYDVVEPDLLFVAGDQQAILTEANVQGRSRAAGRGALPEHPSSRRGYQTAAVRSCGRARVLDGRSEARRVVVFRRSNGGALEEAEVLRCDTGATLRPHCFRTSLWRSTRCSRSGRTAHGAQPLGHDVTGPVASSAPA